MILDDLSVRDPHDAPGRGGDPVVMGDENDGAALLVQLLEEAQHQQVFTNGASQLLKFPEFRDIDKAHDLMSFMVDNKEDLPVPQSDAPMQILIGPENVNDALKESSVVIASYDIGDNMRGLVGVVGPTRMDYAAVAARLSYFAESLSRMFGKKQLPEDTQ